MSASRRVIVWGTILVFSLSGAHAQIQPIVLGGGDIPESSGPSACERDFGKVAAGVWFGKLIHPLCQQGDADSLLAVYLFTMPGWGSRNGAPDDRILKTVYAHGNSNPKLLWVVTTQTECVGPLPGCKASELAIEAAQALTKTDPGNAMAWFALARAYDLAMIYPDKVDSALHRAAKAARVHDYTFDLTKLAERASTGIPTSGGGHADEDRWTLVANTMMISTQFRVWAEHCSFLDDAGDPDRKKLCEAAREQFKHGDSLLTLSGDAKAMTMMQTAIHKPAGVLEIEYDRMMLETIHDSASEREWYEKVASRFGSAQSQQ